MSYQFTKTVNWYMPAYAAVCILGLTVVAWVANPNADLTTGIILTLFAGLIFLGALAVAHMRFKLGYMELRVKEFKKAVLSFDLFAQRENLAPYSAVLIMVRKKPASGNTKDRKEIMTVDLGELKEVEANLYECKIEDYCSDQAQRLLNQDGMHGLEYFWEVKISNSKEMSHSFVLGRV